MATSGDTSAQFSGVPTTMLLPQLQLDRNNYFFWRSFSTKIKSVQSNWGGEYRPLAPVLAKLGIVFRHPCPHTHQQQGRPERKHRHVTEMGLTLLAQAQLPLVYWWDAFTAATFLINRLPVQKANYVTPFELLFSKKLDYTFLKPQVIQHSNVTQTPTPTITPITVSPTDISPTNSPPPGFPLPVYPPFLTSSSVLAQASHSISPTAPDPPAFPPSNPPPTAVSTHPMQALAHPKWRAAMDTERIALIKNKTWVMVPYVEGMTLALLSWDFHNSVSDSSLFFMNNNGHLLLVLVYVDDILITGAKSKDIQQVIFNLNSKFALKTLGQVNYFLGFEAHKIGTNFHLCQTKYAMDILKRTYMVDTKSCTTPICPGHKLYTSSSEMFDDPTLYRSTSGSLQYLTLTRPDLSFAVNKLSQYMQSPTIAHWCACKRILRYIKGTLNKGLVFKPAPRFVLEGFSDADWACDIQDRKSMTGFCVQLGGNLISWGSKNKKQYPAPALRASIEPFLPQPQRSFGSLLFYKNWGSNCSANQTKHIEVDVHFVRELVLQNKIDVSYIPTEEQPADMFTKALTFPKFNFLCSKLSLEFFPCSLRGHVEELVGTDHCTFNSTQKAFGIDDFPKIPNGVNGIEERMHIVWDATVVERMHIVWDTMVESGQISVTDYVRVTSTECARIFNIYPRKGAILAGSDADIIVFNPNSRVEISAKSHHSRSDTNVYEGRRVKVNLNCYSLMKLLFGLLQFEKDTSSLSITRY
uniref:Integrase catalytic domain-containing protein n=1 Tax=Cannabis sativa TaxID=3483 RepID=A0A803Q0C4_CANSA